MRRAALATLAVASLALALALGPADLAVAQSQPEVDTALELYRYRLLQSGSKVRRYPEEALLQQLEGSASVEVIVSGDGALKSATLLASSGHAILDDTALDMLSAAVPLTQIPSTLQNKAFAVRIVVVFRLP